MTILKAIIHMIVLQSQGRHYNISTFSRNEILNHSKHLGAFSVTNGQNCSVLQQYVYSTSLYLRHGVDFSCPLCESSLLLALPLLKCCTFQYPSSEILQSSIILHIHPALSAVSIYPSNHLCGYRCNFHMQFESFSQISNLT